MTRKEEIEKAAFNYINSDVVSAGNMQLAFGDFINGAEWADKTMIEKACEWMRLNAEDYVVTCYDKGELDSEGLLIDFRKAMEE